MDENTKGRKNVNHDSLSKMTMIHPFLYEYSHTFSDVVEIIGREFDVMRRKKCQVHSNIYVGLVKLFRRRLKSFYLNEFCLSM